MPSSYAHYRFGTQVLPELPEDIRRTIGRFRRLYDVGLHGPDLFFNYNPFVKTTVGALGSKFHQQSGREFFTRVCKRLRLEPTEAGMAYLYGVLAHFCLDSVCHGFINANSGNGNVSHTALEAEFDRYLLELDGKEKPYTFDSSPHMKLTRGECVTAAAFYPPATPGNIHQSIRNMAHYTRLLASDGTRRKMVEKALTLTGESVQGMLMHTRPNRSCAALNEPLLELYSRAEDLYPELLEQIRRHMNCSEPLGEAFDLNFEGVIAP